MTIKVSYISEYLFCPLKIYYRYHLDENETSMNKSLIKLHLHQDFNELIKNNLWYVKKGMDLVEIENILSKDLNQVIEKNLEILNIEEEPSVQLNHLKKSMYEKYVFESQFIAYKIKLIANNLQKDGSELNEILFPPHIQSYSIYDPSLSLAGNIKKIEIVDGKYYPVEIKLSSPPLRGVWDSDALKIAAYSILIEQEFDTEVLVGFIEYTHIMERRPVTIDSELREGLFSVLDDIRDIAYHGSVPEIEININKCSKCKYYELCHGEYNS
ncbi:CRISPR-associated protein Cas4 [Methanobacterium alcaliphilum]|uniref:CRISPR-associated protein Cas4 n=1 Tax=Methanobacterium alcaliphilum TaxID=392018 RepID=UPI00200B157A|nr:Dna2/Cas4 domain-containing protein [Methanobacterium alcaliphilum]MCK9151458.1 Dna2/Cas4 domain-containing protein [Methanobacterium alcaliphilum]